jgi:hypothetical protein
METYIKWKTNFEVGQMKDYLEFIATALTDFEAKLENKYSIEDLSKIGNSQDDEDKSIEYEHYIDMFESIYGDFPRRLYSSFFITCYSFIEETLLQICDELSIIYKPKKNDKGIWRAIHAMTQEGIIIDYSKGKELEKINKIRNIITHENGMIKKVLEPNKKFVGPIMHDGIPYFLDIDKDVYDYLDENKILHYYGTFFIFPTNAYCNKLVIFVESFFKQLFETIDI